MGDLTNYDIYKIDGLAIEGYIFSIQEDTDEEPTFHYYMITIEPNKKPSITKLNNTIEIISRNNLQLIPIDTESPEVQRFISLIQSTITKPNTIPQILQPQSLKLTKTQ
jgi:hypothetical protein